jgi:2-desacetyl-2-hydroxyethyl bacteriochlorophyllide A dehydrogenase
MTAISTGTEIRVYRGIPVDREKKFLYPGFPMQFPVENGYSMVGEVVETGSEVSGFHPGDRVFVPQTHRQVAASPAAAATRLPDAIPDQLGVFLSIMEVAHIALRRGDVRPGENVAIVGSGLIGLWELDYCRVFGCRTAVVDLDRNRLKVARSMGADWTGNPHEEDVTDGISKFFGDEGADLVVEAASTWKAIETGMEVARPGGRIVVVARHTDQPHFSPVNYPYLAKNLSLRTSYGYPQSGQRWDRRNSLDLTLDYLASGRLHAAPILTHQFEWEELPDVYARMDAGDADMIGVSINWT